MSKRSREEAATAGENGDAQRISKKLKKEKKARQRQSVPENGRDREAVESEKQEKQTQDFPLEKSEETKLSKEQRKALKRARKESSHIERAHDDGMIGGGTTGDERASAAAEAEQKAERAARKAAKKAAKAAGGYPSSSRTTSGDATPNVVDAVVVDGSMHADGTASANGYVQNPRLSALPQTEIESFIAEKSITTEDPESQNLRPITAFEYLPIIQDAQLASFASFKAPTPVQAATWPYLFAGRDVVGVAETGSGKTIAFGLPCVQKISKLAKSAGKGIKACIVSPTRELALQIHEQMVKLCEPAGLKATCVYGGVSKDDQRATLKGTKVVVATPGRLNDFIEEGSVDLSKVTYLVLDEADRMLDKGFEQEIRRIISTTPSGGRQTLMFTATWPPSVRELAGSFMNSPVKITIGDNHSGELRANARITQQVEVIDPMKKTERLMQLLKQYQSGKNKNDRILVFALYKKEATRIEETIRRRGFSVAGIHGDLSQQKRTESLEAFKVGKVPLLVATDVAARGLDIPAVKVVINLTFPLTVEDYVHRIGRTGRAGQDGKAITLFTEHEKALAGALINVLKAANQPVPEELLKFGTTVKKKQHDAYGAFFKDTGDMKKATRIMFD